VTHLIYLFMPRMLVCDIEVRKTFFTIKLICILHFPQNIYNYWGSTALTSSHAASSTWSYRVSQNVYMILIMASKHCYRPTLNTHSLYKFTTTLTLTFSDVPQHTSNKHLVGLCHSTGQGSNPWPTLSKMGAHSLTFSDVPRHTSQEHFAGVSWVTV